MTLTQFKELVSGSPYSIGQISRFASQVEDDDEVREFGKTYLTAEDNFFTVLGSLDIELG